MTESPMFAFNSCTGSGILKRLNPLEFSSDVFLADYRAKHQRNLPFLNNTIAFYLPHDAFLLDVVRSADRNPMPSLILE